MIEKYVNKQPTLAPQSWVHQSAVVIGDVTLGESVSVWPNAVIRGDVNAITIGKHSNVQDGAVIHATHVSDFNSEGYPTRVGDAVTIGHNAILHGCTIGNHVLIGMGATILDGSVIPDQVIIGAMALVPMHKTLESGYLYLGSPAKAVRKLTEKEKTFLRYSAKHYIKLKNNYQ
ncbi:gamma carbonic anhydrase family protein [Ostreibacterium oceani]|uniref:Gamma carbonic anhydrase family protein n=1 Tax=Ostreibacterium oceani TaxID=2654998 RepID=A0A6N7F2F3_9GAMM|nr:gamma carbonic anhydrase family protein [Ostreibacterium oceani]MPV86978.1 gamma carbonic anhydrase family protein [Ostreibacterium oceani]